jgi:hypothetical protein
MSTRGNNSWGLYHQHSSNCQHLETLRTDVMDSSGRRSWHKRPSSEMAITSQTLFDAKGATRCPVSDTLEVAYRVCYSHYLAYTSDCCYFLTNWILVLCGTSSVLHWRIALPVTCLQVSLRLLIQRHLDQTSMQVIGVPLYLILEGEQILMLQNR